MYDVISYDTAMSPGPHVGGVLLCGQKEQCEEVCIELAAAP